VEHFGDGINAGNDTHRQLSHTQWDRCLINFPFGLLPAKGGQRPSKILIFTLKKPFAENWY
jgi:hypothetical protein